MCYNNCGEQSAQAVNHITILINVPFLVFVCLVPFLCIYFTDKSFYVSAIVSLKSKWRMDEYTYGLCVSEGCFLGVSRLGLNSKTED